MRTHAQIEYCTRREWLLCAAWMTQELPTIFGQCLGKFVWCSAQAVF